MRSTSSFDAPRAREQIEADAAKVRRALQKRDEDDLASTHHAELPAGGLEPHEHRRAELRRRGCAARSGVKIGGQRRGMPSLRRLVSQPGPIAGLDYET